MWVGLLCSRVSRRFGSVILFVEQRSTTVVEFRKKDGRTIPITPKKGGAAAAVLAVAGGVALAGVGAGAGGGAASDVAAQGLRAKTSSSKAEARQGRTRQAWSRMGWKQLEHKAERALKCAVAAYGQVQQYFLRTPCKALDRALFAMVDEHGNTFAVSIAWVRMDTANEAKQLKRLVDTDGTGNVSPLGAAAVPAGFNGQYYGSDQRGSLTVIAEAAPGRGRPDGAEMDAAADIAVLFPPP